jgi:chromosome segregation ATPase
VPKFANEQSYENLATGCIGAWNRGLRTLSKLIERLNESIGRGDLSGVFRNQLASLREQTEAVKAEFQEIEARIKEQEARIKDLERVRRSSSESKANSRKHRSLKQIAGLWRRQRTKRRTVTAVGVRPVIPVYDQRGDFSGFLSLLGTAGPSAPDPISEGAVHSASLAKQQTNREDR